MSDRKTPRTDAVAEMEERPFGSSEKVPADFARALERECEELAEALKLCAMVLSGQSMTKGELINALTAARRALAERQKPAGT